MSHDEVMKMVGEMGLPFAYDHFVEGEAPEPPFLVYRLSESLSLILCGFWDSFFINSPSFLKKGVDKPYKMCGASRP